MSQALSADSLAGFLDNLKTARRLSEHTVKAYARDLKALLEFCQQEDVTSVTALDAYHIRRFAAALHRRGLSPRSVSRALSAVRGFLRFEIERGRTDANVAVGISAPKAPKRLPVTLDADQVSKLLEMTADSPLDLRDRAILELLYSSGLRLAELVRLDLDDLDMADRTVRVTGKGNKTRILPVGRKALDAVREWLPVRLGLARASEQALFVSQRGSRLKARSVQARVDRWGRSRGNGRHLHPHLFRHSFASHMLESSGDLRAVQELLGHASLSTTQIYTHLDFQHLASSYDRAHPRARRRGNT